MRMSNHCWQIRRRNSGSAEPSLQNEIFALKFYWLQLIPPVLKLLPSEIFQRVPETEPAQKLGGIN